ncbi:ATP-binding protein [Gorillibacterium massiliense]|uniref:ATP-binding protein n=1 Tax=Gorillibacterium massiliense TaxID=1280390 RepID=UPI0012DEB3B2
MTDTVFCFITASSGTGKTTFMKRYCHEHESAVYIKLPFIILKSPKSILLAILNSLDVPVVARYQSEGQLIEILIAMLHNKQSSHLMIATFKRLNIVDTGWSCLIY